MDPHTRTQRVQARTQRPGARPDQGARSMLRNLLIAVCVVIAAVAVYRLDPLDKWSDATRHVSFSSKPHTSANALAARIKDDRDCRKYRAEILAYDGKKGEAAEVAMATAYRDAKADNCLNIDIE